MGQMRARRLQSTHNVDTKRPKFNKDKQQQYDRIAQENARRQGNNARVNQRQQMGDAIPFDLIDNETGRYMGDRVVDLRNAVGGINKPAAFALGAGGAVAGLAGLNAYYQQGAEGLATEPYNVAGRMVNNGLAGIAGGIGIDPLAEARNSVREAGEGVGSRTVLEALAADEINRMAEAETAELALDESASPNYLTQGEYIAMVDQRAIELMNNGSNKVDGDGNKPMDYDTAIRQANEQVYNGLRSQGII